MCFISYKNIMSGLRFWEAGHWEFSEKKVTERTKSVWSPLAPRLYDLSHMTSCKCLSVKTTATNHLQITYGSSGTASVKYRSQSVKSRNMK